LKNPVISGEMFYLSTAVPDVITFGQVHGYFAAGLFTSILTIFKLHSTA
jgi:hypothetical protein